MGTQSPPLCGEAYLGRRGPLVDAVRQTLADLQAPWQRQRACRRWRHEILASLRSSGKPRLRSWRL